MVDIAVRLVTKIDARRLAMWILAVAPHITLDTLADDDEKGRIRKVRATVVAAKRCEDCVHRRFSDPLMLLAMLADNLTAMQKKLLSNLRFRFFRHPQANMNQLPSKMQGLRWYSRKKQVDQTAFAQVVVYRCTRHYRSLSNEHLKELKNFRRTIQPKCIQRI